MVVSSQVYSSDLSICQRSQSVFLHLWRLVLITDGCNWGLETLYMILAVIFQVTWSNCYRINWSSPSFQALLPTTETSGAPCSFSLYLDCRPINVAHCHRTEPLFFCFSEYQTFCKYDLIEWHFPDLLNSWGFSAGVLFKKKKSVCAIWRMQ